VLLLLQGRLLQRRRRIARCGIGSHQGGTLGGSIYLGLAPCRDRPPLGRSRGGLSTKIHLAVRGLGCPVRIILTTGQRGDCPQAYHLVEGLPPRWSWRTPRMIPIGLRQAIADNRAVAAIPNNPSRARKYTPDKLLYAQRHLIECCFSKLKQFRRVATRFEKTARNYLAIVTLAATILWLR
jgi:transposase